jgi:hypothetical protein
MPVPSFGPRMVCTRCGIVGADGPAELAGAADAGDSDGAMAVNGSSQGLTVEHRRVLQMWPALPSVAFPLLSRARAG